MHGVALAASETPGRLTGVYKLAVASRSVYQSATATAGGGGNFAAAANVAAAAAATVEPATDAMLPAAMTLHAMAAIGFAAASRRDIAATGRGSRGFATAGGGRIAAARHFAALRLAAAVEQLPAALRLAAGGGLATRRANLAATAAAQQRERRRRIGAGEHHHSGHQRCGHQYTTLHGRAPQDPKIFPGDSVIDALRLRAPTDFRGCCRRRRTSGKARPTP